MKNQFTVHSDTPSGQVYIETLLSQMHDTEYKDSIGKKVPRWSREDAKKILDNLSFQCADSDARAFFHALYEALK